MKTVKAIRRHLDGVIDHLVVVNDGSNAKFNGEYRRVEKLVQSIGGTYIRQERNGGVAVAKNVGLRFLLGKSCDWLITCEDDILIRSPLAVQEYIRVAKTGVTGLSFAHHGEANFSGPVETTDDVEYYFHSIGAWCHYTADELNEFGLLDENLHNAWEHVEMALRTGVQPYRYPDVAGSGEWITEIPGSIEKSSIRPRSDWSQNIRDGLRYWSTEKPDTFKLLFGDGTPLQGYAQSILAQ